MDATYKTNRYKMPLLVITGQTGLHTTFYVAFAFIAREDEEYYSWILLQLQALYRKLQLLDPKAIITDCEAGLLPAMRNFWPTVPHLLCVWHINSNILTQCRKKFDTLEAWEKFYQGWKDVVYASSLEEYTVAWNTMNDEYNVSHPEQMEYLFNTYINLHKRKFVAYWTNQTLNFFTTSSSRSESGHALLKNNLNVSTGKIYPILKDYHVDHMTGDLKLVVDKIDMLLINQRSNYLIAFDEAKMRLPQELRLPVFRDLISFVTPFALRKIYHEYKALTTDFTVLPRCTNSYSTKSGLPCKHIIQERLFTPPGVIKLEDVHPHWRFIRPPLIMPTNSEPEPHDNAPHDNAPQENAPQENAFQENAPQDNAPQNNAPQDNSLQDNALQDNALQANAPTDSEENTNNVIDPLLLVQNPAICKSKGRPVGALNRTWRQKAFDASTQRELSGFEHVQADVAVELPTRRRGRPPGSGRRGLKRGGSRQEGIRPGLRSEKTGGDSQKEGGFVNSFQATFNSQ